MQEAFVQLAGALRERLAVIGDEQSRRDLKTHTARLQKVSEQIEALERQLPSRIDPQLRHFLQRRSYTKALALMEALEQRERRRSAAAHHDQE